MDEIEKFDFEIDPETLDTKSDRSIDPRDNFALEINEPNMESSNTSSPPSLEDVLGSDTNSESELDLSINLDYDPLDSNSLDLAIDLEPALEPEIELELNIDGIKDSAHPIPTDNVPLSSQKPLQEADEGAVDPFFSAYLKIADSLDTNEGSKSLEDKSASSSRDETNDFINELVDQSSELGEINLDEPPSSQKSAPKIFNENNENDDLPSMLQNTLDDSIHKEFVGISEVVIQTVQDVVKEVTPGIVRSIIQDEIDKIKKLEET